MEVSLLDLFREDHLPGSIVTVVYDAYSSAWKIPFILLHTAIERGYFGIVSNYNIPLRNFMRKSASVGFDAVRALEEGDMAIIDLFGTRYGSMMNMPNVFYLDKVEPETLNPKITHLYETELGGILSERPAFRLIHTLDGAALMLGEENTLKLLNRTIATRSVQLPDSVLVLPVNRDVVSEKFVAWAVSVGDYVFVARSELGENGLSEYLYVISAPHEDFEPTTYSFRVTKSKGIEKLKMEKISP
ncbi:hypothetical protein A3L11_06505 [Thermococcus siculi]|uniref:KaiC-like domain-containing protein n=1 Tax=Thermococcus siculi TaxID=72803 RepID=A0A2Z2MXM8_9EURY|nr:hypothetical protein [Thermococcus siculi]ASJ08893.1 hypothetical protein A3L11_06505 [Thermococcus siculi]